MLLSTWSRAPGNMDSMSRLATDILSDLANILEPFVPQFAH